MDNHEVARILYDIADLYQLKGENTYRVRAYQRAATAIDSLGEDLETLAEQGSLESIPGVGRSIADKVREILKTGTTAVYEELKSQIPPGLIEVMAIPGIGPKKASMLYRRLGIRSVEELEQAAKEHRISTETSLSPKAEADILRGIEVLRQGSKRLLLGTALPMAEGIIARLSSAPGVRRIEAAGSIRRRQETIGDIDLVAVTTDARSTVEAFTHLPHVQEIIETGPAMASIWTKAGLRTDLRLTDEEHYGALLHHFTGSKMHNIRLRGLARDRGLTINEYGVHRLDTGETVVRGRTEEEIYRVLGLPWIPPEMREDRGEIEAALEGRLPRLIEQDDIRGDLHCHTRWSDGADSIRSMAEAARDRGYEYLAVCDHSWTLRIARGLDDSRLMQQLAEIRALNRRMRPFRVLCGSEVDIRADGTLDFDRSILEQLDIVVASVHQRYRQDREEMTNRIVKAIESGVVDVLAHPTGRLLNSRPAYEVDLDRVLEAARAHSTALEINSYPDRLDLNDVYAREAKERGIRIAIDTDAHNVSELDNIRYGLAMARRGWLERSDVVNAGTLDELLEWLKSRRARMRRHRRHSETR